MNLLILVISGAVFASSSGLIPAEALETSILRYVVSGAAYRPVTNLFNEKIAGALGYREPQLSAPVQGSPCADLRSNGLGESVLSSHCSAGPLCSELHAYTEQVCVPESVVREFANALTTLVRCGGACVLLEEMMQNANSPDLSVGYADDSISVGEMVQNNAVSLCPEWFCDLHLPCLRRQINCLAMWAAVDAYWRVQKLVPQVWGSVEHRSENIFALRVSQFLHVVADIFAIGCQEPDTPEMWGGVLCTVAPEIVEIIDSLWKKREQWISKEVERVFSWYGPAVNCGVDPWGMLKGWLDAVRSPVICNMARAFGRTLSTVDQNQERTWQPELCDLGSFRHYLKQVALLFQKDDVLREHELDIMAFVLDRFWKTQGQARRVMLVPEPYVKYQIGYDDNKQAKVSCSFRLPLGEETVAAFRSAISSVRSEELSRLTSSGFWKEKFCPTFAYFTDISAQLSAVPLRDVLSPLQREKLRHALFCTGQTDALFEQSAQKESSLSWVKGVPSWEDWQLRFNCSAEIPVPGKPLLRLNRCGALEEIFFKGVPWQ